MDESPFVGRFRLLTLAHVVVLVAACFAVYSNNYEHAYHLDSSHVIRDNPSIRSLRNVGDFFADARTSTVLSTNADYRPVLMASYALNYRMGGYDTWWWHFTQILLHACCVVGLYFLARSILVRVSELGGQEMAHVALFAALVFAVTPTASGVVNYLSARSSLLTAAFVVGAVLAYMRQDESRRPIAWSLLSALLLALALFTKVEAVACLGIFVLYELWNLVDPRPTWRSAGAIARRLAPAFAVVALYFVARSLAMEGLDYAERSRLPGVTRADYLLTQTTVWWQYVRNWLAPTGLVADDPTYPVYRSLFDPPVLMALGGWAVATVLLLSQWRQRPYLVFLTGSALALLSPTSSIVPLAEMLNEHRPYLPLAVLSLVWTLPLGIAFFERLRGRPTTQIALVSALLVLVGGYAVGTYQRNRVFRTAEDYNEDLVKKAPSGRAYLNYARVFMAREDYESAVKLLQRALEYTPYWFIVHVNLGVCYQYLERDDLARISFDRGVGYDEYSGEARMHRGEYRLAKKDYAGAADDFRTSLEKSGNRFRNNRGLATAYAGLGNPWSSFEAYSICLDIDPVAAQNSIRRVAAPYFEEPLRARAGIVFFELLRPRLPDAEWIPQNIATLQRNEALLTPAQRFEAARDLAIVCAKRGDVRGCHGYVLACLDLDEERTGLSIVEVLRPFFVPERYRAGIEFLQLLEPRLPDVWWIPENLCTLAGFVGDEELKARACARAKELHDG